MELNEELEGLLTDMRGLASTFDGLTRPSCLPPPGQPLIPEQVRPFTGPWLNLEIVHLPALQHSIQRWSHLPNLLQSCSQTLHVPRTITRISELHQGWLVESLWERL